MSQPLDVEATQITFTVDQVAKALYIRFREGTVEKTVEYPQGSEVFVDLDSEDRALGVELINPAMIQIEIVREVSDHFHLPKLQEILQRTPLQMVG